MTTETLTLTEFLLDRIDDDEAAIIEAPELPFTSRQMLAECEAKRRIVVLAAQYVEPDDAFDSGFNGGANHVGYNALRYLAAVYADHPDCRDEWKP